MSLLGIDLFLLENSERFQQMCFRLARKEYRRALPLNFHSWDGGRDVISFTGDGEDIIWQAKFVKKFDSSAKKAITESLDSLDRERISRKPTWVLCVPIDLTAKTIDWLHGEVIRRGLILDLWSKSVLIEKLERSPDVVQTFFYPVLAELRRVFSDDTLELMRFERGDASQQWIQPDPKTLCFVQLPMVESSDMVFDVIVRNLGDLDTIVTRVQATVFDWFPKLHGIPGEGLLLPQYEYVVSLKGGSPGRHEIKCEPPLRIKAKSVERFSLRVTDTGYSWIGGVQFALGYGAERWLQMPAIRLAT